MENHERIAAKRAELGWSQAELATRVGGKIKQQDILRIEKGDTKTSKYMGAILRTLGLSANESASSPPEQRPSEGYRPPPEFLGPRDFKIFASAECGPGEIQVFSTEPYDLIPRPWNTQRDPEAFGVLLTGDSMEPLYEAGQYAIVSPRAPLVKGKQALFLAEPMGGDFRASVKRYRGQTADQWLVKQLNPEKEFALDRNEWGTAYRVLGALDS